MKICFPTQDDRGFDATVYNHFGSAPFFTIYDTETQLIEIKKNDHSGHQHGQCQPVQPMAAYQVSAVLSKGMGRRAIEKFNHANIRVLRATSDLVKDCIADYENDRCPEMEISHACSGHSHHG